MNRKMLARLLTVIALLISLPAAAEISMPYGVMGAGGGGGAGANHVLTGTLGQACTGLLGGDATIHKVGFWYLLGDAPTAIDGDTELPAVYWLGQNHPNPFNPVTTIRYAVPEPARVSLVLFDIRGREVARLLDDEHDAGYFELRFDAGSVASGVYFYRLRAGDHAETKKMILLK